MENEIPDPLKYRSIKLRELTNETGVYALCDLDNVPIYVGQSVDGIRTRVRRHLTSARSDIIANRQIDVWEIAYVRAWPMQNRDQITPIEAFLFNMFDAQKPLMNGKSMEAVPPPALPMPRMQEIQIIAESERLDRIKPALRLPRQISQYLSLVDYIQNVKNEPHLKRSLAAHFNRLVEYHASFLA